MDERTTRIVETAITLAERDGYDAVRLRDVAAQANVALGTVYRRFATKDDILVAALEQQVAVLEKLLDEAPIRGETPLVRLTSWFEVLTTLFVSKENLAKALLRSVSSGVPELTEKVARFHGTMTSLIVDTIRGQEGQSSGLTEEGEEMVAHLLQNIWFAELVGWAGGLNTTEVVIERMAVASDLLIVGARPQGSKQE